MLCVAQAELFKEDDKPESKMLHLRFTIAERGDSCYQSSADSNSRK